MRKTTCLKFSLPVLLLTLLSTQIIAQGTWTPVSAVAPDQNGGVMILLSDGTVMAKTFTGGPDGYGNTWDKLTPDIHGSYSSGTWSKTIAAMHSTRLYFSSQMLKDGRVYVAGGEYGTGGSLGEVYNPLTNTWTNAPSTGQRISDANSEILPDGRVLQALVTGTLRGNNIYNPLTNTYTTGPNCLGIHNESAWLKLPDNSTLMIDRVTTSSERYIPSLNQWVADGTVPVALYDPFGDETGGAVLLPDGRAWFIGSLGHTAYYTPSGTNAPGVWAAGPDMPNGQGTPDAAAAMMVNGKVLLATSPIPTSFNHFPAPTSYYEFDYTTNTFTRINAPSGALTDNVSCYVTNMLDLPNGQVLFALQGATQYYVYTPSGAPVTTGKPVLSKITKATGVGTYRITGTGFNGISEGATYGDDWQMNTNYPLFRIRSVTNGNVYYARTFNWNRTGVATGILKDTAFFTIPPGLPNGSYAVEVTVNGIASNSINVPGAAFASDVAVAADVTSSDLVVAATNNLNIYPNPAKNQTTISYTLAKTAPVSIKLYNVNGTAIRTLINTSLAQGNHTLQLNTSNLAAGIYIVKMFTGSEIKNIKLVVQ